MTATSIEPDVRLDQGDFDDDSLLHMVCCNEDVALCGSNLTGAILDEASADLDELCVVCDDLMVCSICGEGFE
jgi:hypothetical protein